MNQLLLQKYNVPVPRYTSYPTVPNWTNGTEINQWKQEFSERFEKENAENGISLYIHLPFCESLCTYCGCNKRITENHSVEEVYMNAIIKEWQLYLLLMEQPPLLRELHLGGGTPTFFSPQNLKKLLNSILNDCSIHEQREFSIEGHPNNTSKAHLEVLYELGFRRISFGVQDNDPEVQRVINRIQPFEHVERATEEARSTGFTSVNYDLIYGLPLQNTENMSKTLNQCISLKPDRIAFYSYAHVPWTSRGQRLFDENDLPDAQTKMQLYTLGTETFVKAGYSDIGMDHFALPGDELYHAHKKGKLHRNFMGYTTQATSLLLGLGVSSISDLGTAFAQNNKTIHEYHAAVNAGTIPVVKGHFLSDEDQSFRKYILDISCTGRTVFQPKDRELIDHYVLPRLREFAADGLITLDSDGLQINEEGRTFLRNICSSFDLYLQRAGNHTLTFSRAI